MLDLWFAQPGFLWTLLALPIVTGFWLYAMWRRRRALAQLGSPLSLRKMVLVKPRTRRWKHSAFFLALFLLGVACARPQWGRDPSPQQRAGRDVILVLDLSRSMLAEQPSRRELAVRALNHLADNFEQHGGNRVALVLFAARPHLLFPLTQDYDHLRHALKRIDAHDYPRLTVDSSVSGTRIGAALKFAIETGEANRKVRPVVILLSDGDDPARDANDPTKDDGEWLQGAFAAQAKHIHVHTVGIGDPENGHVIPVGKDRLEYDGKPVQTKLNEERLQEIARVTGGVYLPGRTRELKELGTLVQYLLDADALREEPPLETTLPVYQQRYIWFLLPAVVLLMLSVFLNEGPRATWKSPGRMIMQIFAAPKKARKAAALMIVLTALVLLSAGAAPSVDSLIRQGNDAFERKEYESAIKYYEQAETLAHDPGLVSFNKATAYYRLKKYRDAVDCYRRCLDDDRAEPARRAKASFDLGNALFQQAGKDDAVLLGQSTAAYRQCLQQLDLEPSLRADARHNLELVQMLWLRARAKQAKSDASEEKPSELNEKKQATEASHEKKDENGGDEPDEPGKGGKPQRKGLPKDSPNSKLAASGKAHVVPDQEQVLPLSVPDTLATLERHAQRISEQRRKHRHPDGPAISTKDW